MFIVRVLRMSVIVFFTIISGLILTLAFWWPNQRLYYFVSHRIWGPGLLWASGAKVRIEGLDRVRNLPPAIYFANHRSYLDIPAMMAAFDLPLYFIAKIELRKVPFLGWAMRAVGMVFVDRKNSEKARQSIQKAGEIIRGGKNIAAYPEGTRSKTSELLTFKKGTFALAIREGIPLVPVALVGTEKIDLNKKFTGRIPIVIRVGKPFMPEEIAGMSPVQLAGEARSRVAELLGTAVKEPAAVEAKTNA